MSKYIIELDENAKEVVVISLEDGDMWTETMEVEDLEQLNSDYINEHYGSLQDKAYKRGINDGSLDVKQRVEGAYQRGLDDGKKFSVGEAVKRAEYDKGLEDAWECVKKLYLNGMSKELFGRYFNAFIQEYSARQAIEMLKAHEQKKDDEIEVGDEVEWDNDFTGDRFIVTRIYQPYGKKEQCDGIDDDGDVYRAVLIESLVKTGRHFDIASILEDMRND